MLLVIMPAHFYSVQSRKLELSAAKVLNELQHIYKVNMVHAKTKKTWTKVVTLNNQQKQILKALKCSV